MIAQLSVVVQKISVNAAKQMGMTLHGAPLLVAINFWHLEYYQPMGSLHCSWENPSHDCDGGYNACNHHCTQKHSCDHHDHWDCDCKPTTHDHKGQSYHTNHQDQSRSISRSQSRSYLRDPQSSWHNHGHYIHQDDHWGRKQSLSPVTFSHSRSGQTLSLPQPKSPPVLDQPQVEESKSMEPVGQNNPTASENNDPKKI